MIIIDKLRSGYLAWSMTIMHLVRYEYRECDRNGYQELRRGNKEEGKLDQEKKDEGKNHYDMDLDYFISLH